MIWTVYKIKQPKLFHKKPHKVRFNNKFKFNKLLLIMTKKKKKKQIRKTS